VSDTFIVNIGTPLNKCNAEVNVFVYYYLSKTKWLSNDFSL